MPKKSVNEIIVDRIIERIKSTNELPWSRPWKPFSFRGVIGNAFNIRGGTPYRGFNSVLLSWLPYELPIYATFKQVQELGGHVMKGQKSHTAIFYKMIEKEDEATGEITKVPLLRYYSLFNIAQCEGLAGKIPELQSVGGCGIPDAQRIVDNYADAPKIVEKAGAGASYSPAIDRVLMPLKSQFHSEAEYYSTLFHELTHSTGHSDRLNRPSITEKHKFGSREYAKEELVSELGASFLCGLAGIERVANNDAAYIASWLKTIKEAPSILGWASAQAQKAYDLIALPPKEESESEDMAIAA